MLCTPGGTGHVPLTAHPGRHTNTETLDGGELRGEGGLGLHVILHHAAAAETATTAGAARALWHTGNGLAVGVIGALDRELLCLGARRG